jgi:hypothetical protein
MQMYVNAASTLGNLFFIHESVDFTELTGSAMTGLVINVNVMLF